MKKSLKITVTYEREFDSEWYEDKNPDNLLDNVRNESQTSDFLDVIYYDLQNLEYKITIDEV